MISGGMVLLSTAVSGALLPRTGGRYACAGSLVRETGRRGAGDAGRSPTPRPRSCQACRPGRVDVILANSCFVRVQAEPIRPVSALPQLLIAGLPRSGLSKSVTLDFLHRAPAVKYALRERPWRSCRCQSLGEFCDAR